MFKNIDKIKISFFTVLLSVVLFEISSYASSFYDFVRCYIGFFAIGILVPIMFNLKSFKPVTEPIAINKNIIKFSIFASIGSSIFIQCITLYFIQDHFFTSIGNSFIYKLNIDKFWSYLLLILIPLAIFMYLYLVLYLKLIESFNIITVVLICSLTYATLMFNNGLITSNIAVATVGFFLLYCFKNVKISILFLLINSTITAVLGYIYIKFIPFLATHYFSFAFMVIGFICIIKAFTLAEKLLFYRQIDITWLNIKSLTVKEFKIIWISVILIGLLIIKA